MIHLQNLLFRRADEFELSISDLRVDDRERIAIIGPSGSGKTTLIDLIAGILTPDNGDIVVAGKELTRADETARRRFRIATIGLVFQRFELMDYLTVEENILLPFLINPAQPLTPEHRSRARDLAQSVGMGDQQHRRPDQLSHGERQRVAVCRALVSQPRLLIADEPTGNLDVQTGRSLLDLIFAQVEKTSATLLMVTHDPSLLANFDRTVDVRDLATGGTS